MQNDRLTTIDEYGNRRFVIPAEVTGPYRMWRTRIYWALIFLFLVLPWIKIHGQQALLLDIQGRRFVFMGKLFFAHDGPMVFLALAAATLGLGAVTAIWGRVWCGWACPQTVFIDAIYRKIEILIEGKYIERRRLHAGPWTLKRFSLSAAKWFSYLVVSSIIAHSFFALIVGADHLYEMVQRPPDQNHGYFLLISSVTGLLMFNFGWFREQFCTIMCPYGRIQSVLMDEKSLTVLYDEKRGDCVECNRCVEVCPAKIDIRHGMQLECIACTACIDACNIIMRKVHKPENLIQYQNLAGTGVQLAHPRGLIYGGLAFAAALAFGILVMRHKPYDISFVRAKDTPYQEIQSGRIVNHYKAHLFNQSNQTQVFSIVPGTDVAQTGVEIRQAFPEITLEPGKNFEAHLFLEFPRSHLDATGSTKIPVLIKVAGEESTKTELTVVGPIPDSTPAPPPESNQ